MSTSLGSRTPAQEYIDSLGDVRFRFGRGDAFAQSGSDAKAVSHDAEAERGEQLGIAA
jgi:hypothetical protein